MNIVFSTCLEARFDYERGIKYLAEVTDWLAYKGSAFTLYLQQALKIGICKYSQFLGQIIGTFLLISLKSCKTEDKVLVPKVLKMHSFEQVYCFCLSC